MPDYTTVEEMYHHFKLLFDYNPPKISSKPKSPELGMTASTSFYDKHIGEHLILKRVIVAPSLLPSISNSVDVVLDSLNERKIKLSLCNHTLMVSTPKSRESDRYTGPIVDEESVASAYQSMTSNFCLTIASMMMLSPKAPRWESLLVWKRDPLQRLDNHNVWDKGFGLQLIDLSDSSPVLPDKDILDSMEEETLQTLHTSYRRSPMLAIWDILPPTSEALKVLTSMDGLSSGFENTKCSNSGFTSSPLPDTRPPDAQTTAWGPTLVSFVESLPTLGDAAASPQCRIAENIIPGERKPVAIPKTNKYSKSTNPGMSIPWPSITVPQISAQKGSDKTSITQVILERAWSRAVHLDSTFIVFHCGDYERIGFRHRATQTLFISELIDTPHHKKYGKIHLGLYLSILHDHLVRAGQLSKPTTDGRSKSRKRRRSDVDAPGNIHKRPKTRAAVAKNNTEEKERRDTLKLLDTTSTTRNVALIELDHTVYNSPAPAVFIRSRRPRPKGNVKLGPHQYLSIVITSDIAAGATGSVHGGTLKLSTSDHKVRTLSVVVKLSFHPEEQERMRHESFVYEKLAAVDGVPNIVGLFEDIESNVIALVMTHVGTCLTDLYPDNVEIVVPEPQRSTFLQILKDIHHAGVQHRDLRSENLSLDSNGKAYIIDFDLAKLNPTDGAKKRELADLTEVLDGCVMPQDLASPQTVDEEDADSPR